MTTVGGGGGDGLTGNMVARLCAAWATGVWVLGCASSTAPVPTVDRTLLAHALPAGFGAHPHVVVEEVTYGPGGSTHPHRHACPVVGYVLEGRVRMQLQGGPEQVYGVGSTFYEDPTDLHVVSANASHDERARFLVVYVCDDERPLFVPEPTVHGPP